ncbi:MAG: sodium:solute symporter [Candidatus Aminicenantes bacterium]
MPILFFLALFLYFAALVLASIFFSRKMRNIEDFFLASRKLPFILVYSSLVASWFGATSTLVSTDVAFHQGVSSFWVMGVPAVLTVLLLGIFLARPIRRLPMVSLPDLVERRYGRGVRHLASVLIIWYMILLASSQMVAAGRIFESLLGIWYVYGLLLGIAVVLFYSIFGGFFSVALTDGLQFVMLAGGIIGLFLYLSPSSSLKEISMLASHLGKEDYFNFFFDLKKNLLTVLSFTLAWTISPIAWQRIQAARTEKAARKGLFLSSGTFFILYGILVFIGLYSLPLFFSRGWEGPILSGIISSKEDVFLGSFLLVAVVAAVMSTMDTAINTGALSLTRDIYQQLFSSAPQGKAVLASRISTLIVGASAFLVATQFRSILKTLGLASEIMAEGLFIPGIAMIFLKKRFPLAGFLSLLMGGGFSVVSFLCEVRAFPLDLPAWPYSLPYGVGLGLFGFITGFMVDRYGRGKRD